MKTSCSIKLIKNQENKRASWKIYRVQQNFFSIFALWGSKKKLTLKKIAPKQETGRRKNFSLPNWKKASPIEFPEMKKTRE